MEISNMSQEAAKNLLKKLCTLENLDPEKIKYSNKPLWVDTVKSTFKSTVGNFNLDSLEDSSLYYLHFSKDKNNDESLDAEAYPLYFMISRLLYVYGDTKNSLESTIVSTHEYLNKWFYSLLKLIRECDYKKLFTMLFKK